MKTISVSEFTAMVKNAKIETTYKMMDPSYQETNDSEPVTCGQIINKIEGEWFSATYEAVYYHPVDDPWMVYIKEHGDIYPLQVTWIDNVIDENGETLSRSDIHDIILNNTNISSEFHVLQLKQDAQEEMTRRGK